MVRGVVSFVLLACSQGCLEIKEGVFGDLDTADDAVLVDTTLPPDSRQTDSQEADSQETDAVEPDAATVAGDTAEPVDTVSAADTITPDTVGADLCPLDIDCSLIDTPCSVGACNAATGICELVARPDLLPCDDGDPCTLGDVCAQGACRGSEVWTLLHGEAVPTAQGWLETTNQTSPIDVTADGEAVELNTLGPSSVATGTMVLYSFEVPESAFDTHVLEWTMHVLAANPHNPSDAGVALMPAYTPMPVNGFGTSSQRSQMIYFDEDAIGWASGTGSASLDTTDGFHTYRLAVDDTGASVSVDGTEVLTRPSVELNGIIAFGDQTNDGPGVTGLPPDGHIRVSLIQMVPRPDVGCGQ